MTTSRLVHYGISTTDLDRAVAWYRDVLGFQETKRFEKAELQIRGALLVSGDSAIEILEPYQPQTAPPRDESLPAQLARTGANHFAVSVADVKAFYEECLRKGVTMVSELIGGRFFFCKDPDGTPIEIRQV